MMTNTPPPRSLVVPPPHPPVPFLLSSHGPVNVGVNAYYQPYSKRDYSFFLPPTSNTTATHHPHRSSMHGYHAFGAPASHPDSSSVILTSPPANPLLLFEALVNIMLPENSSSSTHSNSTHSDASPISLHASNQKRWTYRDLSSAVNAPPYYGRVVQHTGLVYHHVTEHSIRQCLISKKKDVFEKDDQGWYLKETARSALHSSGGKASRHVPQNVACIPEAMQLNMDSNMNAIQHGKIHLGLGSSAFKKIEQPLHVCKSSTPVNDGQNNSTHSASSPISSSASMGMGMLGTASLAIESNGVTSNNVSSNNNSATQKAVKVFVEGDSVGRKVNVKKYGCFEELATAMSEKFCICIADKKHVDGDTQSESTSCGSPGKDWVVEYLDESDGRWMVLSKDDDEFWSDFVSRCSEMRIRRK
jgi:hypothetical protein